jgi:hypothetical protein
MFQHVLGKYNAVDEDSLSLSFANPRVFIIFSMMPIQWSEYFRIISPIFDWQIKNYHRLVS